MAGRLSYVSTCQAKILQLENSPLAERIRRSQQRGGYSVPSNELPVATARSTDTAHVAKLSDEYRALDIEMGHQSQGLDDSKRPTVDWDQGVKGEASATQPPSVSYDELRKQNRQQFEVRLPAQPGAPAPAPNQQQPSQASQKRVKRNQYGDIIE